MYKGYITYGYSGSHRAPSIPRLDATRGDLVRHACCLGYAPMSGFSSDSFREAGLNAPNEPPVAGEGVGAGAFEFRFR